MTNPTNVSDVMSSPAITVGPEASFEEVVDAMLSHGISGLPVVGENDRLLGVITEADLISKDAYGEGHRRPLALIGAYLRGRDPQWLRKASGQTAEELMTWLPTWVAPGDDIAVAAKRMLESNHNRLPVVADGRVVGVIARHDLLKHASTSHGDAASQRDADVLAT